MTYKTHVAGGILLSSTIAAILGQDMLMAGAFGAIGGLFPDIDHKSSYIGKRLKPLSFIVSLFGHRKITHSLLFLAILSIPLFYVQNYFFYPWFFFLIGCFSHIFYDMLTPAGVPIFYPFFKVRIGFYPKIFRKFDIKTGKGFGTSISEKIVLLLSMFLIVLIFSQGSQFINSIDFSIFKEISEKIKNLVS